MMIDKHSEVSTNPARIIFGIFNQHFIYFKVTDDCY